MNRFKSAMCMGRNRHDCCFRIETGYLLLGKRRGEGAWEIVQISTVFGEECEFWTVTRKGSDLRGMLDDFEFGSEIARPAGR